MRYDGCSERDDTWENMLLVKPAASIAKDDPEITFLNGKWLMTSVGVNSSQYGTAEPGGGHLAFR